MIYQRNNAPTARGFTLVEVMIALIVFAIVVSAGFASLRMGMGMVDNARHQTRASQIMQSEVERLRSLPWEDLTALPSGKTTVSIASQFVNQNANYTAYALERSISGSGNSRKIELFVAWTDISGRSHSRTYVTQYTRGGLYDYIQ